MSLTAREREVLLQMATGASNDEIAGMMKMSAHTVKFHVINIGKKLKTHSRTETVVKALKMGIMGLDEVEMLIESA